jgi:electron transport complex protein RnfG
LKVEKDGGDVDALTGATITSRAFSQATQLAFDMYMKGGKHE